MVTLTPDDQIIREVFLQQLVAEYMVKRIIAVLEIIDINHSHAYIMTANGGKVPAQGSPAVKTSQDICAVFFCKVIVGLGESGLQIGSVGESDALQHHGRDADEIENAKINLILPGNADRRWRQAEDQCQKGCPDDGKMRDSR